MRRVIGLSLLFAALVAPAILADGSEFDPSVREIVGKFGRAVVGISCRSERLDWYGTGVVISPDGLVLTSTTVVPADARQIHVWLMGGAVLQAELVATDKSTESSLIQAKSAENLSYVELADSSKAWLGQRAYTFGNPFHILEYDGQVAASVGVVSGIYDCTVNGDDTNQSVYKGPVLETDAAVNPGSDGGPLLDGEGRLLGIMSLGFQKERRLGMCIPVHLIREKLERLKSIELRTTPERGTGEPIGSRLAASAEKVSPAVVWLEIERSPEDAWKPERAPMSGLEAQANALRQMMDRPDAWATGLSIEGGEYILTSAYHVTHQKDAEAKEGEAPLIKKILVHADGLAEPVEAEVVARNDPYDVALLKPKTKLPASAELGDSSNLDWGHFVAVLGRHAGSKTVTLSTGIVSTPARSYLLIKVFQTDAMINYANLGGPVVDLEGNVVGLATFVSPNSDMGLNSGVGVFTGSNTIKDLLASLHQGETVKKPPLPFLGVGAWQGEDPAKGALVAIIYKGSAAHKAGVLPGDTILSVDANPIGEWADLVRTITSKQIGQEIEFEVMRGEERKILKATLGRRP